MLSLRCAILGARFYLSPRYDLGENAHSQKHSIASMNKIERVALSPSIKGFSRLFVVARCFYFVLALARWREAHHHARSLSIEGFSRLFVRPGVARYQVEGERKRN
jgi:hypothetical protein